MPSEWEETFGLVAIQAMACGVPPVAPAHGSFPELIRHEHDGVLFEPGSPDALVDVLRAVERDPARFACYGRNARASYEERFDPDTNVQALIDIYEFGIRNPVKSSRFNSPSRARPLKRST